MTHFLEIFALLTGFYMLWNIGANDVANAIGTSVGSRALTFKKAIVMAAILEFAGAFLMGGSVSETIRSDIIDPQMFASDPNILIIGMLSALIGASVWLQIASSFGWPVSTTHAIIGALLGFGLVIGGPHFIEWKVMISIVASWVISPACSGFIAFIVFSIVQSRVLHSLSPVEAAKRWAPILVGIALFVFGISVLSTGIKNIGLQLSFIEMILIALGVGCIGYLITFLCVRRVDSSEFKNTNQMTQKLHHLLKSKRQLEKALMHEKGDRSELKELLKKILDLTEKLKQEQDTPSIIKKEYATIEHIFSFLQIMSACFVAFAHGSNDVANSIGPVASILEEIKNPGMFAAKTHIPLWLLAFGGFGIVVGLATYGYKVIETIGKKITELTPTRGFCAEFSAATTILVASKMGLPISTTHCIVGAILGIGLARGISALNIRVLKDIIMSWVITIPSSAVTAVVVYYVLKLSLSNFLAL